MHKNLSTSENIGGVEIFARITRKGSQVEPLPKIFRITQTDRIWWGFENWM